ncbi:MAG TPA: 16S rRNA (cytidine(1402)-2'-O)-methyltransferase [Rhodothermales bacterium]|nr:16S rRNA (cytidine(1402)-2'-O)-methyltransferase [Rhodothermales bacterium]
MEMEVTRLHFVPTPIGNLEDITLRAIRILKEADLIACEDTRTSRVLLDRYEVSTPTTSYHEHNARKKAGVLIERVLAGDRVALITDAGTPGISDPGFLLVRAALEAEVPFEVLPGATAFVPALVLSGLPNHRFAFEGFLPSKKGRTRRLAELASADRTSILYESPHRLIRTLTDLVSHAGPDRQVSVSRELTKKFEETIRGRCADVLEHFRVQPSIRGEFVIVVSSP